MSTEVRAGWPCSHLIQEEPVVLGSDRVSLQTRSPIAGAGSVRILANDSQYIPQEGLTTPAKLASSQAAPYKIERCSGGAGPDGNLLTISTSEGNVSVRLPEGARVPLEKVQRALRLSNANALVVVGGSNGALQITDRQASGRQSFLRVSGRGASSLGFRQTGSRGREVYPGWGLVARQDIWPSILPSGVTIVPARYPQFRASIKGNPTLKVSYTAMPERCSRCQGTYIENDYRFDLGGEVVTITGEDLLYQACLKAILTVRGSNPYHSRYGSHITRRVGHKIGAASSSLIKEDVTGALRQVQALQKAQRQYQQVSSRELLYSIDNVSVSSSAEDPTLFYVDVTVRNGSGQPINLNTVFSVPGTIALGGSVGTPLGVERAGLTGPQKNRLLLDG